LLTPAKNKLNVPVTFEYASSEHGLDIDEWERIVDRMGRKPNEIECSVFGVIWSEEYCNKSSAALLKTIERKEESVNVPIGSRTGILALKDGRKLAIRAIANNDQLLIDPYQASQSSMSASMLELATVGAPALSFLNLIRFGATDRLQTQRALQEAVRGISDFSNRSGVPIAGGELYFHPQHNRIPLVNSFAVGLVTSELVSKVKPERGASVVYVGANTGLDSYMVGDPLLSSALASAVAEAVGSGLLIGAVATGRGGLAAATFDLAAKINAPIQIDLERIPLRFQDLAPKEILLSSSADRIICVVERDKHRQLIDTFNHYGLESVVIGQVTNNDGIEFFYNKQLRADIPFLFALGGSTQKHFDVVKFPPMLRRSESQELAASNRLKKRTEQDEWTVVRESTTNKNAYVQEISRSRNIEDVWLDLLANPNLCSRTPLSSQLDSGQGLRLLSARHGDAGIVRIPGDQRALAFSLDSMSLYVGVEPYLGSVQSIADGMRNLAAVGATPAGLAYSLNFGDPNNYKEVCDLSESIRGIGDSSKIWNIPMVSNFISLFNGSDTNPILPTPAVLVVGEISDISNVVGCSFKERGDTVLLLGNTLNEIGCSEYGYFTHQQINRLVPDINFDLEKKVCELMVRLHEEKLLRSAHDISSGGVAVALAECCLCGEKPIGASLTIENTLLPTEFREDAIMFSETSGRFLVSCDASSLVRVEELCAEYQIPVTGRGKVGGKEIKVDGALECTVPLQTAFKLWTRRLGQLLGHHSVAAST
jgi:phosphoribosylformylglycinamidine synthase